VEANEPKVQTPNPIPIVERRSDTMSNEAYRYYRKIVLVSAAVGLIGGIGFGFMKFIFELLYGHSASASLNVACVIFFYLFIWIFAICSVGMIAIIRRGAKRLGTSIAHLASLPAEERHTLESKIWRAAGWRGKYKDR
jgi:hypothetical protein